MIDEHNDTGPTWKAGKAIWVEDDAMPPGYETVAAAWERLFNEKLDTKKALEKIDHGDCFEYLMPNGYVASLSYPGNSSIHEVG